jgi:NarL family two-component system sensor histidine kinase LiaS
MTSHERIRLAQELHDGIAQDLVGIGYSLDLLLAAPETPVDTRIQLRTLRFTVTEVVEKVRREMFQLRQPRHLALGQQIQDEAAKICKGLTLTLDIADSPEVIDENTAYEVARISAELLRNVVAHSRATVVSLSFSANNGLVTLDITDNGEGGVKSAMTRHGLSGIRERAEHIGATFALVSDGSGTRASLQFPIK